tara:strand:- start:514 stop:759 length:246 start_codon:yes stop_codon:yes gene_type:complete
VAEEVQEDLQIMEIQDKAEQVAEAMELNQSQEQQVQELPILAVAVVEKMVLMEVEVEVMVVQAWLSLKNLTQDTKYQEYGI